MDSAPIPTWPLRQAARIITQGGVVAWPTEAVYGLGCNPYDGQAVARLLRVKRRDPAQGLILIAADLRQLADFVAPVDAAIRDKIMATWPGPYTWILPAAPACPRWLTGRHLGLAVRVTAHPVGRALCRACAMPLVSTSANRHGRPPARTALQTRRQLGRAVDMIIAGAVGGDKNPSQIRDALTGARLR